MLAFVLDVEKQNIGLMDIESDIHEWYKLLNCNLVEMPKYQIEGKYFTFICDEEGLLKSNPIVSAVDKDGAPILVGSLIICNTDWEEGDVTSLTEEDIQLISRHIKLLINVDGKEVDTLQVIADVEY